MLSNLTTTGVMTAICLVMRHDSPLGEATHYLDLIQGSVFNKIALLKGLFPPNRPLQGYVFHQISLLKGLLKFEIEDFVLDLTIRMFSKHYPMQGTVFHKCTLLKGQF